MEKKTILLLGGFGFIGTNVLNYIDMHLQDQYEVIVFDFFQKHPFNHSFKCIKQVVSGEFGNAVILEEIISKNKIDLVFHFIHTTVPVTSLDIRFDIESNLLPTIHLLDLMHRNGISNIVYLSSGGAVYGRSNDFCKETDHTMPISSYGIIKLTIEKYLNLYRHQYGINSLILRLSNPFGRFHYNTKQGFINIALKAALNRQILQIWGDGTQKKDFIWIDDFSDILFKLLEKNVSNEVLNVGSGEIISLNQVIEKIKDFAPDFQTQYIASKVNDVSLVQLNLKNLLHHIGDYKFTSISDGLKSSYEWLQTQH